MSRRDKIEVMLQESPDDLFLNYAYGMELAKESEVALAQAAFACVREINTNYVPAYFQEGQMLVQDDRIDEARSILEQGIAVARRTGDDHALGEMTEYLDTL